MSFRTIFCIATVALGPAMSGSGAAAAERFQKLSGSQITARFAGMEMSDDVHWRDRYEKNGTIASQSMGFNSPRAGSDAG